MQIFFFFKWELRLRHHDGHGYCYFGALVDIVTCWRYYIMYVCTSITCVVLSQTLLDYYQDFQSVSEAVKIKIK